MKYSEFKKLMEDKGFYVDNNIYDVLVYDKDELTISTVSKSETLSLCTDYVYFKELGEDLRRYIAQAAMELACTELKDREEDEKYYLRQKGIGSWSFLNFHIYLQEYIVAGKKDDYTYKTQFTQSEIERMPECYTHPAVWEKIKVESEE